MAHPSVERRQLPSELFREIVQLSRTHGTHTLASLALACRDLRAEVEPILYHSFEPRVLWPAKPHELTSKRNNWGVFAPKSEASEKHTSRCMAFLTTANNNSRLAGYLRIVGFYQDDRLLTHRRGFWELFENGISKMTNLKTLVLHSLYFHPPHGMLRTFRLPQLEDFGWSVGAELGDDHWYSFLDFLSSHPSIVVLSTLLDAAILVPPSVLPHLTTFIGVADGIVAFCRNRPVTSIVWKDYESDIDRGEALEALQPFLGGVHTLELETDVDADFDLWMLAPELKRVERLNIVGERDIDAVFEMAALTHLKISRDREQIADGFYPFVYRKGNQAKDYVERLFRTIRTLQIIDVEDVAEGFHRYIRGHIDNPELIPGSIYEWCPIEYRDVV